MKKQYYVFACSFFFSLGSNILGFSLIYRLTDRLAFSPGQIGRYMALGQLFFFIGCNLYHRFGSGFNPLKVFSCSALMVFLCSLVLSFARAKGVIYASYWIIQTSTGLFWPPVMAWLTEGLTGKELNRKISFFNRSWMAANVIGPLLAGALYQWNSNANFIILSISFFLVSILLWLMRRYTKKYGIEETLAPALAAAVPSNILPAALPANADSALSSGAPLIVRSSPPDLYRYRGWIGGFCSGMFVGILVNIVPLHIRDGLGYSERLAGMMLFLRCVAGFVGFSILARFTAWQFESRWFLFLQSGLIFCTFLLMLAGSWLSLWYAIVLLYGLLNSGCYNSSIFYSGSTGKNPKKNLALHEIFLAIGNAAGSAGGGFIYQYFRFTGVCFALILLYGMGLSVLIILNRKEARLLRATSS